MFQLLTDDVELLRDRYGFAAETGRLVDGTEDGFAVGFTGGLFEAAVGGLLVLAAVLAAVRVTASVVASVVEAADARRLEAVGGEEVRVEVTRRREPVPVVVAADDVDETDSRLPDKLPDILRERRLS